MGTMGGAGGTGGGGKLPGKTGAGTGLMESQEEPEAAPVGVPLAPPLPALVLAPVSPFPPPVNPVPPVSPVPYPSAAEAVRTVWNSQPACRTRKHGKSSNPKQKMLLQHSMDTRRSSGHSYTRLRFWWLTTQRKAH